MDPSKDRWTGGQVTGSCSWAPNTVNTTKTGGDVQHRHWMGEVRGSQDHSWVFGDVELDQRVVLHDKNRTEAKGFRFPAGTCQRQILPNSKGGRRNHSVLSNISLDQMHMVTGSIAWEGASHNLLSVGEPDIREI